MKEPFDVQKEVARALEVTKSLAPPGKKTAIYQWSGDTEPFERIIRETRAEPQKLAMVYGPPPPSSSAHVSMVSKMASPGLPVSRAISSAVSG